MYVAHVANQKTRYQAHQRREEHNMKTTRTVKLRTKWVLSSPRLRRYLSMQKHRCQP